MVKGLNAIEGENSSSVHHPSECRQWAIAVDFVRLPCAIPDRRCSQSLKSNAPQMNYTRTNGASLPTTQRADSYSTVDLERATEVGPTSGVWLCLRRVA